MFILYFFSLVQINELLGRIMIHHLGTTKASGADQEGQQKSLMSSVKSNILIEHGLYG